uniref:Uncharacterized protein n=1 Tax=Clytia hemisphaerica TaxID=252671 RepID=A0A7M5V7S7_9CNID
MSPPVPMHILLHQCWTERLHQCCQYCGEINVQHSPITNQGRSSTHPYQHQKRQRTQRRHPVGAEHENDITNLMNDDEEMTRHNYLESIYQDWEEQPVQAKSKANNKTSSSVVRLVYSKQSYNNYRKEAEQLLNQLPFPARYELVDDDTSQNESLDEDMDLIADLLDAYDLESTSITSNISNFNDQDAEALREYLEKLKQNL